MSGDFLGNDPGAISESLKIGAEHPTSWERVAVFIVVDSMAHMMNQLSLLISRPVQLFPPSDGRTGARLVYRHQLSWGRMQATMCCLPHPYHECVG